MDLHSSSLPTHQQHHLGLFSIQLLVQVGGQEGKEEKKRKKKIKASQEFNSLPICNKQEAVI